MPPLFAGCLATKTSPFMHLSDGPFCIEPIFIKFYVQLFKYTLKVNTCLHISYRPTIKFLRK
jgi:hypothetical protein